MNIPLEPMEYNEALIENLHNKDKINLIKKYELGKLLPTTRSSGYGIYSMVVFDPDCLAEYDSEGAGFKKLHGITEKIKKRSECEKTRRKVGI